MDVKRGDIFLADLNPVVGSEQGGVRPVLVVQNDIGNKYSPTIIVAAITSKLDKAKLPTHVEIKAVGSGLEVNSCVLCEHLRTLDKVRLKNYIGKLHTNDLSRLNRALSISIGIFTNV